MVELVTDEQVADMYKGLAEPAPEVSPPVYGPPEATELDKRYSQHLFDLQVNEDQTTAIALRAAQMNNQKLYLKAMELAGLEDLPPDLVYRNIEQFEERHRLARARDVLKTNPPLAEWLQKADNSKMVTVENLEELNNIRWFFEAGARAVNQGTAQVEVAKINWDEMFGTASRDDMERANDLENLFTDDFGAQSWVGEAFTGGLSQLPILGSTVSAGLEGATYGGLIGAGVGSVVPGFGTLAGAGGGATVGGTYAAGKQSLVLNSGLAYAEFKRFRAEDGRIISPETARGAALISGTLSAGLDMTSLSVLLKATGLGSLVSRLGAKAAIREALKDKTFRSIAANVGKRFAGAIAAEVSTEMIQEGVQIVSGEIAKGVEEHGAYDAFFRTPVNQLTGDFKPVTFEQAISRVGEAGRAALMATAFLGVLPMGGRLAIDYSAAKQQVSDHGKLAGLVELAKASKLVKENPVAAAEATAATLQGSDNETLYISTDDIRQFMQEEDSVEMAALSKIPNIQKTLQEAVQSGADVAIPTADFYAYVAPTDAAASLIDKMKFKPEGMSKKEAEAFIKSLEKIKEQGIPEPTEPKTSVAMDVYEQVRKAGATPDQARAYSTLYGAFFDSMASQTGRNAWDIYKAYNLEISQIADNPAMETLGTFNQAQGLRAKLPIRRIKDALQWISGPPRAPKVAARARQQILDQAIAMVEDAGSAREAIAQYVLPVGWDQHYLEALEAIDMAMNPDGIPISVKNRELINAQMSTNAANKAQTELIDTVVTDLLSWNASDQLGIWDAHRGNKSPVEEMKRAKVLARTILENFSGNSPLRTKADLLADYPLLGEFLRAHDADYAGMRKQYAANDPTPHQNKVWQLGGLAPHLPRGESLPMPQRRDQRAPGSPFDTFNQEDTADNYTGLDRISWKNVKDNIGIAGDEYSLVISPNGRLYNLTDEIHAEWASRSPNPEEAVRVTGYWSPRYETWTFGARFNEGRLTVSQLSQIKQSAALAKVKMEDLVLRPFDISELREEGVPGARVPDEKIWEIYKGQPGDGNQSLLEYLEQHPPVDNFNQEQNQGSGRILRGSISFEPDRTAIRLFKNANLSTLLHESGHLFLQVMSDLVQGKRAYGNSLFQDEEVEPGDYVHIFDKEGNQLTTDPVKVTAFVQSPVKEQPGTTKPQITVRGGKGIYDLNRVLIVSKAEPIEPDPIETEVAEPEESEAPPLPIGESPAETPAALETASLPEAVPLGGLPAEVISDEDAQYFTGRFDFLYATNGQFQRFVKDKPQSTAVEKRNLIFEFYPKSNEAMRYRQSKAHREQNADPEVQEAVKEIRTLKKANPLGVQTENLAALNVDDTIKHVGSIIEATARVNSAISGRQQKKVMTALRLGLRVMRKGSEAGTVNAEAWAELERDINTVQNAGPLPDAVKKVVNEYIALYKKDEGVRAAKEESKNKREGKEAARQVEAVRAENLASAIKELSTVVQRIEKIELQKEAREQLKEDMDTLRAWLGEDGPVFSTAAHEKFAVGFEAYLFEGIAPSAGLARAFDRFKSWLKLVYRKITNIGVQPTPEVKAVFDRMLTIDQSIQNEVSTPAFQPAFSSPEEMGVPQEEFDAYMERVNKLAEVGREAAEKVAVGEAAKLRTAAVKAKKKELRAEAEDDLMSQKVYRVIKYLQGNKLGGVNGLKSVKLDRARVEAMVGKGKLNTIPHGSSLWTTKEKGGVDPDTVATMFGYSSGAEMIAEIQATEPLKVAVEARVDKLISEMVDEDFITPPEVAEMASAKLRSGVYQEFLRTEIRTFAKLMGIDFTDAHETQFKRMASDIIEEKSVRNVQRRNFMREYTEADRKIGKLLDEAIKKKDYATIMDLRRKQLFNSYLIQNAYDAKQQSNAAVKYLRGFTKGKVNVIDQAYLSQIRNMVISLGFMKGQIDATAAPFSRFLDAELDSGAMIVVDPRVKRQDNRQYTHLSHGELMAVYAAVKNLDFMGRQKRKVIKEGKVFDLNMAVQEIELAMDSNLLPPKGSDTLNKRGPEWAKGVIKGYFAAHTKIEQLCDWIDGRAPQGPAHRYIFQPLADAQAREIELTQQYAQKVLEIITRKGSGYWGEEFLVPEIKKRVKRSEALAVALNMGNESNLKKLKKGMGWTDEQLAAVTDRLDAADWQIAQEIWDTIDGLWPMVLEVAAKTGIPRPDKVEPTSFTNKHGTFRGGYYPVVYDPSKSADALARGLTTKAEQQFGFQPQSVFPSKSFANDRDNEYARPIFLDMQVLPTHIAKVVHYVTHAEAAYNVQRIMSHGKFKDRLLGQFGEAMFQNMKGWIENITRGETDVAGLSGANRFMRAVRQNLSLAALGFRATTVIAQAGGIFSGAEMIGLSGVARGIKEMYGSASISEIQKNFAFIREKSAEMRHRTQFLDRDLTFIGSAFNDRGMFQRVKDAALTPMMVADNIVASSVWMGAYTRQIARTPHDEQLAINYADKVVRLSQGAAGAKDLAAVQRGNEFFKLFTMFYTYFAAMQNRLQDLARTVYYNRMKTDAPDIQSLDTPHEAARYLYLIVLPSVIFDFMMKGALQGDFSDDADEKDKSLLGTALWKVTSYTLAGMVGVRDLVSFVGKDGFEWRYSSPPLLRNLEMILERAGRTGHAMFSEEKDVRPSDAVRTLIDLAGVTSGAPVDAPSLIFQNYLKAQEKGEDIGLADFVIRR